MDGPCADLIRYMPDAGDRYRELLARMPALVFELTLDGDIIFISDAIFRMTGYTGEELIGGNWWHTFFPGDLIRQVDELGRLVQSGDIVSCDTVIQCKDGSYRTLEVSTANSYDHDGRLRSIVGYGIDVTDRRATERALRESNAILDRTLANMQDAVFVIEANARVTISCNSAAERVFGYKQSEMIGRTTEMFHTDREHFLDFASQRDACLRNAGRFRTEWPFRRKGGSYITAEIEVSPLNGDSGSGGGLVCVIRDVTEMKLAERGLHESRRRMQTLLSNLPGMAYRMSNDSNWTAEYVSDGCYELTGYRPEELIGNSKICYEEIIHPDDRERVRTEVNDALSRSESFRLTYRVITSDGETRWAWEQGREVASEDGTERWLEGFVTDITEHKLAEAESSRQTKRAEALLNNAASLNAQLDLDTVLRRVCDEAVRALGVAAATVALCNPAEDQLDLVACSAGMPADYMAKARPMPRAQMEGYIGGRQMIVFQDLRSHPEMPNANLYEEFGIRTAATAAMLRNGELVGAINMLCFDEVREFTGNDLSLIEGMANQAAQAIANARLLHEADTRLNFLQALRDVDRAIVGSLDLGVTLDIFLSQVVTQLGVHAADVLLLDEYSQMLEFAKGHGFRSYTQQDAIRLGEGPAGRAARERRLIRIPDLARAGKDGALPINRSSEGFVSYYAIPLITKGQVRGVLEVFHRTRLEPDDEWIDFLEALAGQAAIAIDNASLFQAYQQANNELILAYDTTLEGWSRALDLRDKETEGHSMRVTELSVALAHEMGISRAETAQIRRGALLHDIGKMGIPDGILLKPGPLDGQEWKVMRMHPSHAYELLSGIPFLRPALDIPYCHHERWDGAGYPRGLKGEQIPIAARVFAVVDMWDALTSDRPYRSAWPEEKVKRYLRENAGTHVDPRVVEVFLRMIDEYGTNRLDLAG